MRLVSIRVVDVLIVVKFRDVQVTRLQILMPFRRLLWQTLKILSVSFFQDHSHIAKVQWESQMSSAWSTCIRKDDIVHWNDYQPIAEVWADALARHKWRRADSSFHRSRCQYLFFMHIQHASPISAADYDIRFAETQLTLWQFLCSTSVSLMMKRWKLHRSANTVFTKSMSRHHIPEQSVIRSQLSIHIMHHDYNVTLESLTSTVPSCS